MKRHLFTTLFLFAMLVTMAGTASAAPAASGTATLVSVQYVVDKGPVFVFDVKGKFSKSELRGSLQVNRGGKFGLYCTQPDNDTVVCNSSKKVSGVNVSITWGGSTFWTFVPVAPVTAQYCYSVYDWNADGPPYDAWVLYGSYCQDDPASYGDSIQWYNPGWQDTFEYQYLPESPNKDWCSDYHKGDAYYFPECFEPTA